MSDRERRRYDVPKVLERLGIKVERHLGAQVRCRCPSGTHPDAHPSWRIVVRGEKAGRHVCDSCGFGGGLADLVAHALKLDPVDEFGERSVRARWRAAFEWLDSGESGVVLPEEVPAAVRIVASPARELGFRLPPGVVVEPLDRWPAPARDYLLGRGVAPEQVERWRFGYAVDGRLAGRVVLVVRDERGAPVTYVARTYLDDESGGRTLEAYKTPNTWEKADRSAIFGVEHWPEPRWDDASRRFVRDGAVWNAEGIFKVLAVERVVRAREGRWPAVSAILGSRVHSRHVLAISTFGGLVHVGDPDQAGEGVWDRLRASFDERDGARRVTMPLGHDADSVGDANLEKVLWRRRKSA